MVRLILLLFVLILICLFFVYQSKTKHKRLQTVSGKVLKITPVFKATNKIEFGYYYKETYYTGFTLANEQIRYVLNGNYEVEINPLNPKDVKLNYIKYNSFK